MIYKRPVGSISRKPLVSLIIPTLNEANNLPLVLPYIPLNAVGEVILVDGRSTDNTVDIAKRLMPSIKVVLEPKPGKGSALRRGYQEAAGDILVVIDADGSHDPREIPRFVQVLMEGADFVKGSRFAPSGGTTDMPRLRKFGNWAFVQMTNLLFSQSFTDLCYGYHAFWRNCLDHLELEKITGFEIDTALYLQAVRKKLKVVDVPSFEGFRFYGIGKLKTFPDGWLVLKTIFRQWLASFEDHEPLQFVGFRHHGHTLVPVTGVVSDGYAINPNQLKRVIRSNYTNLQKYFEKSIMPTAITRDQEALSQLLLFVTEHLGASSGSIFLLDEQQRATKGYLVFGRSVEVTPVNTLVSTSAQGVVGYVARNRQPILVENTSTDPRWQRQPWEVKERVSRSALVVPFVVSDRVVAVLTVTRPVERPFTQEDLHRLAQTAIRV